MYSPQWASFFGGAEREMRTVSFEWADRIARIPDREVPQHTHDEAHFIYIVRGTYVTEARNGAGECGAGSVIFNPPGTKHRDRFRTDRGRFFAVTVAREIAERIGDGHAALLRAPDVGALLRQARNELLRATAFSDLVLEGVGLELAGSVAKLLEHPDRRAPNWLLGVRDALHDRCTQSVKISELARQANVHPIHLARAFRQYFDCSPGEYLRRCRIEHVQRLLLTDLPLAELALEAGFSDQSQLTHAFRRATGTTPGAFRRDRNVSCAQDADARPSRS